MLTLSPSRFRILSLLFAILLFAVAGSQRSLAQSTPPTHKPPKPPPPPAAVDQQQFISYWTTETGWRSELQLRNNQSTQDLTVVPVLRTADGTETPLAPVTVKPKETKSVDLESEIGSSNPQLIATYGSVALRYESPAYSSVTRS